MAQRNHTTGRRTSQLDAAARILAAERHPMSCPAIVELMLERGYWATKGKTPGNTLYAGLMREIQTKGRDSRFCKVGKGLFALARS